MGQEAALEKLQAGEGRNVEHVALADQDVDGLDQPQKVRQRRRRITRAAEAEKEAEDALVTGGSEVDSRVAEQIKKRSRSQESPKTVVTRRYRRRRRQ